MDTPIDLIEQEQPNTATTLDNLTMRMAQIVTQNQTQTSSVIYDIVVVPIGIKLDGTNYALWSQIMEMYISGKDKLGYINGDLPPLEPNDLHFRRWRT